MRDFVWAVRKELTPISADVFVSIPERAYKKLLLKFLTLPTYQVSIGSDIFAWSNMSELSGLTLTIDLAMVNPSG
jgi:hypothetical protein